MNQRNQTLTNEEVINDEIVNAKNAIAQFRQDSTRFHDTDSFPKPVMVYSNPNFKSIPTLTQTKLYKQNLKKSVISPDYEKSRTLFLNREPGRSYADHSKDQFYNPETGTQYGDSISKSKSYQRINSEGNSRFRGASGQRPSFHDKNSLEIDELERAKQILNRGAMELKANLGRKPHSFNTKFQKFYQQQIRPELPAPGTVGDINAVGKIAQVAAGVKRQVQFSEESYQDSNDINNKVRPVKSSKALYKIKSKPGLTKLVHQPSSGKQEALQSYKEAYSKKYKSPPRVKKMDNPVQMVNIYPDWQEITANNRYLEGVLAYNESVIDRRPTVMQVDPIDIDDN